MTWDEINEMEEEENRREEHELQTFSKRVKTLTGNELAEMKGYLCTRFDNEYADGSDCYYLDRKINLVCAEQARRDRE